VTGVSRHFPSRASLHGDEPGGQLAAPLERAESAGVRFHQLEEECLEHVLDVGGDGAQHAAHCAVDHFEMAADQLRPRGDVSGDAFPGKFCVVHRVGPAGKESPLPPNAVLLL
jgi:hypothetical protein